MSAYEDATRAYMAGEKTVAQTLLGQALRANPRDQASWLLLAQCVDVVERKKYCLQQVLLINPKSPEALQRLAELEKRPTPPFQANTVPTPAPAPTPSVEPAPTPAFSEVPVETSTPEPEPLKPVTRPLASSSAPAADEPRKKSTTKPLASFPVEPTPSEEPAPKPITRPLPPFPLEAATEEPRKPITRPLAPPPEAIEPKKPVSEPLPPPPPALQEILNARAQGGANDETLITSRVNRSTSPMQPLADADEDFAPLPDSIPPVSGMESALMDDRSFKPGPFAEQEPAEPSPFASPFDEPDLPLESETTPSEPQESLAANEDVTLIGATAPVVEATPEPPAPAVAVVDKAAIRARLEEAVSYLEQNNKLEGIKILNAILKDDPRTEMAWMWLGAAEYDVNRQRECYLRALEINPKNKMARQRLNEAEDKLTAAGIALQPLAEPLPPDPTQPVASNSRVGLWIGIIFVLVVLFIFTGVVFIILSRR